MPPKRAAKTSRSRRQELEEEQRRREQEEQERLEKERLARLEADRKAREEAAQRRKDDIERRTGEATALEDLRTSRNLVLAQKRSVQQAAVEWRKFIACSRDPDPLSERDVGTFVAVTSESAAADVPAVAAQCNSLVRVLCAVESAMFEADDPATRAVLEARLRALHQVLAQRLDEISLYVLQRADLFTNAKSECQVAAAEPMLRFGLWANLQKQTRLKGVEWPELGLSMEVPKAFAHLVIGVRAVYSMADPYAGLATGRLVPAGGVLQLQIVVPPPAPKVVKAWTIRPVAARQLTLVSYPPVPGEPGVPTFNAVPLRVTLQLPPTAPLPPNARVAWWDAGTQRWSDEDVMDVRLDLTSRSVSFQTLHLGSLALVQDRLSQYPIRHWQLCAQGTDRALLTVDTAHDTVQIEITEQSCVLLLPSVAGLGSDPLPPGVLLQRLASAGINLVPGASVSDVPDSSEKVSEIEHEACEDVALCLPAFAVTSSRWNRTLPADRVTFAIRPMTPGAPPPERGKGAWQAVLYTTERRSIVEQARKRSAAGGDGLARSVSGSVSVAGTAGADGGAGTGSGEATSVATPQMDTPAPAEGAAPTPGAESAAAATSVAPSLHRTPSQQALEEIESNLLRLVTMVQATEDGDAFDATVCADTTSHDSLYQFVRAHAPDLVTAVHQSSPLFCDNVAALLRAMRLFSVC